MSLLVHGIHFHDYHIWLHIKSVAKKKKNKTDPPHPFLLARNSFSTTSAFNVKKMSLEWVLCLPAGECVLKLAVVAGLGQGVCLLNSLWSCLSEEVKKLLRKLLPLLSSRVQRKLWKRWVSIAYHGPWNNFQGNKGKGGNEGTGKERHFGLAKDRGLHCNADALLGKWVGMR